MAAVFRQYVLDCRRFYLYERSHPECSEGEFLPRLESFEEHFITSNDEADKLARDHDDIREAVPQARRGLDSGAVAFCIYAGRELAHSAWLATSESGRRALDHLGFEVRFDQGVAWTGSAWTAPAYRGRGLLTYGSYRRFEYLARTGFPVSRGAVETDNFASQRTNERFKPRVYAVGRQWRLFRWRWWSERAVPRREASHGSACAGTDSDTAS